MAKALKLALRTFQVCKNVSLKSCAELFFNFSRIYRQSVNYLSFLIFFTIIVTTKTKTLQLLCSLFYFLIICLLAVLRPTSDCCQGRCPTNSMLISAFYFSFRAEIQKKSCRPLIFLFPCHALVLCATLPFGYRDMNIFPRMT